MSKSIILTLFVAFLSFSYGNIEILPTIVGGRNATLGQFPYMVSLQGKGEYARHACGGGILNRRWILTAAHCIFSVKPEQIAVVVGSIKLSQVGQIYEIGRIEVHPGWHNGQWRDWFQNAWNDIGLMKTTIPIEFNEYVQPVAINRRRIFRSTPGVVAGFGMYFKNITSYPEEMVMSDHLQFAEMRIISHFECDLRANLANFIDPNYLAPVIHMKSNICTVEPRGVGICYGDSGSMLLANNQIVGITVATMWPCGNGLPDIYTRVSSFSSWIDGIIFDLS